MTMMGGSPTDGSGDSNNQEVFDMDAFRYNFRKMDKIRSFMGIVSGCVAGVLGLTGISGLGEYIFVLCAKDANITFVCTDNIIIYLIHAL